MRPPNSYRPSVVIRGEAFVSLRGKKAVTESGYGILVLKIVKGRTGGPLYARL